MLEQGTCLAAKTAEATGRAVHLVIFVSKGFKEVPPTFPYQLKQSITSNPANISSSALDSKCPPSQQWRWCDSCCCPIAQSGHLHAI